MARIPLRAASEMSPELRQLVDADHKTPLELGNIGVYAHRPELAVAYANFMGAMRANRTLPGRLVELVRLRVAFHNQCRSCMAVRYADGIEDGVTEDLVCQLESPGDAEDLSDAERAAIDFADRLATDHLSISDATIDGLRQHFTNEQIVELGLNVGVFVGFGRLSMAWNLVDDLPDRYRDPTGATITPWGADDAVVVGTQR